MAKKSGKSATSAKSAATKKAAVRENSVKSVKTAPPAAKSIKQPPRLKRAVRLPSAWRLARSAWQLLWRHKKLFFGITLVYGLLNLVLVQGLASSTDVTSLKNTLDHAFHGHFASLASGASVFAVLVTSAGNGSSQTAGAYQLFLGVITSLAVIWTLRQVLAGSIVRIRDAYYQGMYPLIPFILVLLVIGLELIPLLIGSGLYSVVITNGIATNAPEKILFAAIFAALAAVSIYLIISSIFALYIVTLPDMTPLKALRSARQLVKGRRWSLLRKILFLPVVLLLAAAIIMVPIIIFLTALAQWVFFLLTMFALVAVHAYMYITYRELLNE
ncbi:MAG TPA: hypothetical protein VHC21_04670 [Candidatus Saccharimonadales bacterium]|nr:hypothetical protein [Candidatus Saccharimonadales bacterium]